MNLPPQYINLKTLHQELFAKSADTHYAVTELLPIINRAVKLINELALEHPSEEMKTAQATALTLLEKSQKQAENYYIDNARANNESGSTPFSDVLQPALEAVDVFLHTTFPDK